LSDMQRFSRRLAPARDGPDLKYKPGRVWKTRPYIQLLEIPSHQHCGAPVFI